jgi:hypothetical protein
MLRLVTILKGMTMAAPVLLVTAIVWRETTVRTELAGSLAEGVVLATACVFWRPLMKETRRSPRWRRVRR